jgi:FKBP-type peptidyl-prolyl cis-trans isomerase
MRSLVASVVLAAGFAAIALAQPGTPPAGQPTGQPPAPPAALQPIAEPPMKMPVPDMPVVERKELEGGLIVEDMKIGTGYEVKPGDAVVAFYHGTLKDGGTEFDSAFRRGEPIPFSLNGVVQGWSKGVPGMKVGGIRKLTIPYAMGYGEMGSPPKIPAKADLVFVIQLEDAVHWTDTKPGTGEEIWGQCVAVTNQTITTAEGTKVSSEGEGPYVWIPGEMRFSQRDDAMQLALKGMKVGGKRIVHIPKQMNPAIPEVTNRPTDVTCDIDMELIAARNLQPKPVEAPATPPVATPVPTTPPKQ